MYNKLITNIKPLGFTWETGDPFLFCVHHLDHYPKANKNLGPAASLDGRNLGQDFTTKDGWRMYHGDTIPGFPAHPHRGFETVTVVLDGFVDHSDSHGAAGRYGNGDVQWMTAGSGIVHEEFHSQQFTQKGGELEMVQLWVNLPARDKMTAARYQALMNEDIPVIELPDEAGRVRLIAGHFQGHTGAAETFSPIDVWDLRLNANKSGQLNVPEGHSLLIVALDGDVRINGKKDLRAAQMAVLSTAGKNFSISTDSNAKLLVLSGRPLDEPVVGYGPFVMNSPEQIREAINDFQSGRFGRAF